jgi:hypothetical protein
MCRSSVSNIEIQENYLSFKYVSDFGWFPTWCTKFLFIHISIYLSGLVTAVAIFRNPYTIPFCLTTDLLLNVLFSWLLVHLPCTFFLDILFLLSPGIHSIINFGSLSSCILLMWPYHWSLLFIYNTFIKILHMFQALPCSSSGGLRRNYVYVASGIITVCRWLSCAPVKKELFFLNWCTGQSPAESNDTRGSIYTITT